MYPSAYYTAEQRFNDKFSLSIVATLAVMQMLTTFAIVALEIGHNILHIQLTNLFVGFWTSIPFTILWISMFAAVCCCRRQSCATHAVIQNILGFIFACILIGINTAFIRQPDRCFFSEGICQKISWTSYISDRIECLVDGLSVGCGNTRIALIIAQLACAVIMGITCLIYLLIYTIIIMRISKISRCLAAEAVMTPNSKGLPMGISHHHQSYTVSSHPSASLMMPMYSPRTSDGNYVNYLPANHYATINPQLTNERF